jgi:tyrosinase
MMHHTNIDRLFAMWQAIYPQQPISFRGQGYGQMGTPRTSSTGANDPLKPFQQSAGGYLTSTSISRIGDFGYTYPELPFWNRTAEQLSQDVKGAVNAMYGGGQNALQRRHDHQRPNQYFALLKVNRTMVPLPCEIKVYVDKEFAGSITLLSIPEKGFSYGEVPLRMVDDGYGRGRALGRYRAPPAGDAEKYFERKLKVRVENVSSRFPPLFLVAEASSPRSASDYL